MEVMAAGAKAMQNNLVRRLEKLDNTVIGDRRAVQQAHDRLKRQTRRIFASLGGTRANLERIWLSIYDSALKRLTRTES